ncbi:MAG: SDR family NAD(P)-dependent oxidoreductase [Ignavibacteria bacterium]
MSTRSGKNTILITGATDGIGIEFSRLYAGLKYNIIATGRNEGKLSSLKTELENKKQNNCKYLCSRSFKTGRDL